MICLTAVTEVNKLTNYFLILLGPGLTLRIVMSIFDSLDNGESLKEAMQKNKKRVIGAGIAVTLSGFIAFGRGFF